MKQATRALLAILTLVALTAGLAAIVPHTAGAAAPAAADPGLTLTADSPGVVFGGTAELSGQLSVPGATLKLSRRTAADADFVVLATLTADATRRCG